MKKYIMPKMSKKYLKQIKNYAHNSLCIVFFYFITIQNSPAQSKFLATHSEDLSKIEGFLNNIINLSCKFIQTSNGNVVEGKFYLTRNKESAGKMRIEYLTEPKILIVANGAILSYHDIELDEISRLSTNTTPASFLTRPKISFEAKDVEITNIQKNNNEFKVSVMKKNRKEAGEFSLIFKIDPFEFVRMEVKNDLEQVISVQLKNLDFQSKIPDKLFIIKDSNNQ